MIRRLIPILLICALLPSAFAACSDDDEPDIPDDIDVSDELPADWPDDVPIYPEAELKDVVTSTEEGAAGTVATFQSADDVNDVISFYQTEFESGAWTNTDDPVIDDESALFLVQQQDGSNANSSVTIAQEDDNTEIVILIASE